MTNFLNKFFSYNIKFKFVFSTPDRESWIKYVSECRDKLTNATNPNEVIEIVFEENLSERNFYPIHIVLLTCFIDEIKSKGYLVKLSIKNKDLNKFLFEDVSLSIYWIEKIDHIESPTISDLNVWRIVENQKESYSINVTNYFKRNYFNGYDLSPLKVALNELYFNIFDHARANGNAYSYIRYSDDEKKFYVAICDFGLGIATTLRHKYPDFTTDKLALENCIKIGISSQTQKYNKGFGLDNVASNIIKLNDQLRIVSNCALLRILDNKENAKSFELDFNFKGTLVYFEISIDNFEKEEIIEEFSF